MGGPTATMLFLVYAVALGVPGIDAACLSKPLIPAFKRHGQEPASAELTYCLGCGQATNVRFGTRCTISNASISS